MRGGAPSRRAAERGFTLVELMVVVVIIGLLAAIAVPTVSARLRERRTQESAQRIASLYREARMRAMGRGAAMLVQYNAGRFTVMEAQRPPSADNADCTGEPSSSCVNTNWALATSRAVLATFEPATRSEYEGVTVSATSPAGATYLDVCFTPLGRSYQRSAANQPLTPMASVLVFSVQRAGSVLTRGVTVLPNGTARLAL